VELAVIIGSPCHRVGSEDARSYVGAYANFNEGSVRDYQKHTSVPTAGKNFPASGAMGPWIVTADEVPDPHVLAVSTTIDGEVMQSANTDDLIFDVDAVVSYISEFAHLQPGDVIATGTPSGIGFRRDPKRFLKPGETVTIEVEGLGKLVNVVRDELEGD
jgi:2-keto-4-pentenoate hydratase/2-oxohepta-3-ene-1,7-dioic acid hydratase in catechol pathway